MNKPHPHAEAIHAWADGKPIQWRFTGAEIWSDLVAQNPKFDEMLQYRIKPAASVIETKMTAKELSEFFFTTKPVVDDVIQLANAVLARAIADGQVVPAEILDRIAQQCAESTPGPSGFGLMQDEIARFKAGFLTKWKGWLK